MLKRTIGVTIFGVIFILSGLYSIFLSLVMYEKLKAFSSAAQYLSFLKFLPPTITVFALIGGFIYIIIGIGIFRLRFWAWYLTIANEVIRIISLPNPGFIYGWQVLDPLKLAIQAGVSAFILWFFMRPKTREQFLMCEERFKPKSRYAALIVLLLVMTISVPAFVLGYKTFNSFRGQPFLVKSPLLIGLSEMDSLSLQGRLRAEEAFNLSFLAPKDFVLQSFDKEAGILMLGDIANTDKGFMTLENKPRLDVSREAYRVMQFKNTYQFEDALYSNNWGIILLILRNAGLPNHVDDAQIKRFETSTIKGFVKYGHRKDRWIYDCSIYDKLNNGIGNIVLVLKEKDFSQDEALKIISSIRISKKEDNE